MEKTQIKNQEEKYCIVLIFNDNYLEFAKRLIKSIIANNSKSNFVILCIYDGVYYKLSDNSKNILKSINNSIIKFKKIDSSIYNNIIYNYEKSPNYNERFKGCILKYEIFNLVYDKVLYLDCDMIVNCDIQDIFKYDIPFGVVQDMNRGGKILKKRGEEYFNSGLIYLGNKKYINKDTFNFFIKKTEETEPNTYIDQYYLNTFSQSMDVYCLPYIYNFAVWNGMDERDFNGNGIIHYWEKYTNLPLHGRYKKYKEIAEKYK